jgi:outer membrane lipoprotein-sorting protein
MAPLTSWPALRWLAPAAVAALVIGGGAAAGRMVADARPTLPPRTAAQLLADLQTAHVTGMSGTVVERADLGLPQLPDLGGDGAAVTDVNQLLSGTNTIRVWYAGPTRSRVALLSTLGETDVVHNGRDAWLWQSRSNTATHMRLPADAAKAPAHTAPAPGVGMTPQQAADAALKAIDPSTAVSTSGSAMVAGRPAYELVLAPKDTRSLVGQVRLAVDAASHVPLRVEVYPKGSDSPAFRTAFDQISFATPDAHQFVFNPPPGAKVKNGAEPNGSTHRRGPHAADPKARAGGADTGDTPRTPAAPPKTPARKAGDGPRTVGTGWTTVVVAKLPGGADAATAAPSAATQVINRLPRVSGAWGSGRLLTSRLFSALLTDDGRVLVGAVAPDMLYAAATAK